MKNYLNERSYSEDNKRCWYTHKRLRQAYFSLRRNTKYLFVYQDIHIFQTRPIS